MRLIHTADWHLGRLFHGVHLTEDQAHALDQLVGLVRDVRPEAVLVAGDIYDRAVPPPEAVTLLDDTLTRIAVDLGVPVILLAGNHDSPDRLGFGAKLMAAQRVHVFGRLTADIRPVVLQDEHGPVSFVVLPYAEPAVVREELHTLEVQDHNQAMHALTSLARNVVSKGHRAVLMSHAFVAGGEACESERPLSIGGAGTVEANCFTGFQYTALGHLHRPQAVGSDAVQYSGSLLKYSFSEAAHTKSVSLVEIGGDGAVQVQRLPLLPRREVRIVEGSLAEVLEQARQDQRRDDYVLVRLTDRGALFDPIGRIREAYPNCLELDRSAFFATNAPEVGGAPVDHRSRTIEELFADFMREVTGEGATADELGAFREVVEELERREREA